MSVDISENQKIIQCLNEELGKRDFKETREKCKLFLKNYKPEKEEELNSVLVRVCLTPPEPSSEPFTFGFFAFHHIIYGRDNYEPIFLEEDVAWVTNSFENVFNEDYLFGEYEDPKTGLLESVHAPVLYIPRNLNGGEYYYDGKVKKRGLLLILPGNMVGIVMYGNWSTDIKRIATAKWVEETILPFPVLESLGDLYTVLDGIGDLYEEDHQYYQPCW